MMRMSFGRSFYALVHFCALFVIKETSFVYQDRRGFLFSKNVIQYFRKVVSALKYISNNRLFDFEFHDAVLTLESYIENRLIVHADFLNIHKDAEQNPFGTDMEITSARLSFENCTIKSYELLRALKQDENGQLYSDEPQIIYSGDEGRKHFIEQLEKGITVFDFGKKDEETFYLDISSEPCFTVCFSFEDVLIEWDDYKKPAWYVR